MKIINIGGTDIVDGTVTLTLGVVWQLCSLYWEERVGKVDEKALVEWGNSKVPAQHQIKNLKDPNIANCQFLLNIIESVKPQTVDFSKLKDGNS